jgi:peptidyl-prolyl cis-trans isomerase A (cyclophilin A)
MRVVVGSMRVVRVGIAMRALCAALLCGIIAEAAIAADVCSSPTGNLRYRYRVVTSLGDFEIELCRTDNQVTVDNFISYIEDGSYTDSGFIHRSLRIPADGIDIVQGGGWTVAPGPAVERVEAKTPIPLNSKLPNLRGTLAMARTSAPDSATSQWFLNVEDNPSLDPINDNPKTGYTVFGQVISGMATVDAMAAVPTYDMGGVFADLPLDGFTDPLANPLPHMIYVTDFVWLPEPGSALQTAAVLLSLAALARRRRRI